MRPATLDIKQQGDLGGVKVQMGFDENSLAHIISVLTDLYSDPEMAIIREYSTNAWDSHVEAGVTRPIEVTTPTGLSPYFTIKDYGIGLDIDGITDIYSKYGASTKRDSNDFNGTLGLGCKSALTYTNQFMLTGIKNGIKTLVSISRTDTGSGVMEIVSATDTDEPNGVEVQIPVKRSNSLESKAKSFYQYWNTGTVILNGEPVEQVKGDWLTDKILLVKKDTYDQTDVIVMGNVAYEVQNGLFNSNFQSVAFVDIGDVHFTPSRESLHYTNHTKSTIEIIKLEIKDKIFQKATEEIQNAPNKIEAMKLSQHWVNMLSRNFSAPKYKGQEIPQSFRCSGYDSWPSMRINRGYGSNYNVSSVMASELISGKVRIVTGLPEDKATAYRKARARNWGIVNRNAYPGLTQFIFIEANPDTDWIDPSWLIDYAKIEAETKAAPKSSNNSGFKIPIEVLEEDSNRYGGYSKRDRPTYTDGPALFVSPQEYKSEIDSGSLNWGHFGEIGKAANMPVVVIGKNRFEKFQRDVPGSMHIHTYLRAEMKKAINALSKDDVKSISMDHYLKAALKNLPIKNLLDPRFANLKHLAENLETSVAIKNYRKMARVLGMVSISGDTFVTATVYNPLDDYPLAKECYNSTRQSMMDEIVFYMNTKYTTQLKGNKNAV